MSFYVGCYLIDQDVLEPLHTGAWCMPDDPFQHMAETSNVEDLKILPTDMDSIPTQIQYGCTLWSEQEGLTPNAYSEFYPNPGAFYVRSWTSGTGYYGVFYPNAQAFYVRSWTSGTGYYDAFYPNAQSFYVRPFTATDPWNTFYAPAC
jgi:hypothetical protein